MDSAAIVRQLEEMREGYRAHLPVRLDEIVTLWGRLEAGAWDTTLAGELLQGIHRLAGSGATFGFEELGRIAGQADQALKPWVEAGQRPDATSWAGLARLLADLQQVAQRCYDEQLSGLQYGARAGGAADEGPAAGAALYSRPALVQQAQPENGRVIVLVEDDAELGIDLATQIRHFGYDVRVAHDLHGLPALLARAQPAAVVMDIMFPEGALAGATVLADLQQNLPAPAPVIFMSARDDFAARLAAVRAGGHAYFVKPLDVSQLIDTLDRLTGVSAEEPFQILIVDDDSELAAAYALTLEGAGIAAHVVSDPRLATMALRTFQADLLLLDMYMPGCTGFELAAVIRQQEAYVGLPIVFLSAETDPTHQHTALDLGGDDFLTKPITGDELVRAVLARAQRARSMRAFMVRDSLTGLLHHSATNSLLELEIERALRDQTPLAVAMIDLDHFKTINDTYGHRVGDGVLKSLARLLQQRLRRSDVIGRYGGEEFMVLLPGADGPAAAQVFEEIRSSFAALRHYAEGTSFYVTFSCGVAGLDEGIDAARLVQAADMALYRAKRRGRNQVHQAEVAELLQSP